MSEVSGYYSKKFKEFGANPKGVDWNGFDGQLIRFTQLLKIVEYSDISSGLSINDLGCGYGAIIPLLENSFNKYNYYGVDISIDMIESALSTYSTIEHASFEYGDKLSMLNDFSIASGVLNVKLDLGNNEWWDYIVGTLDNLNQYSSKGFAFNCLTKYSDSWKMHDYLYYADPCRVFDLCKTRYSKQVALLHDYGLYEFTILVRK